MHITKGTVKCAHFFTLELPLEQNYLLQDI